MKSRIINKSSIFRILLPCFLVATFLVSPNTLAVNLDNLDSATTKAMSFGLFRCYSDELFRDFVNIGGQQLDAFSIIDDGSRGILLPNYNSIGFDSVSCRELVFGKGDWSGLFGTGHHGSYRYLEIDESERRKIMEKLQYTKDTNSQSSTKCFKINAQFVTYNDYSNSGPVSSNDVCAEVKGNKVEFQIAGSHDSYCQNKNACIFIDIQNNNMLQLYTQYNGLHIHNQALSNISINGFNSWAEAVENIQEAITTSMDANDEDPGVQILMGNGGPEALGHCLIQSNGDGGINVEEFDRPNDGLSYKLVDYNDFTRRGELANGAQSSIFGSDNVELSNIEIIGLYSKYLDSYDGVEVSCNFTDDTVAIGSGFKPVKKADNGEVKQCYVKVNQDDKVFNGVRPNGIFGIDITLDGIIEWLNNNARIGVSLPTDNNANNNTETSNPTCMNSGGAGSLGWIVCPILDFMSSSANGIYNDVLEPNLQVESGYFNQTETREAWGIFQTIANTLFIILVLIVVFSQLTGVGIDNYGIKKILPKLIVAAVLINLSYLICVICVDLSNIIGNGLQNIFSAIKIPGEISIDNSAGGLADTNIGISGGAITALVILGSIAGAYAVYSNPAFLITLLISALGVLISVLFLFVLLAGRKAAIVVLTILSPVVFILYMLPNTKKLFDKWLKLWEAMLLLYPICGLLIGGGNFVSQLLLAIGAGDDVFTALTAMAIGILPIFFVPTLLKSAFAAMGTIGSSIAGFGNRLRSGATGRLRNSERVKNAQERSQARQKRIATQRRAGVYVDGSGNIQERRRPSARLRRRLSGTGVGRFFGMDRAIGQSTAAYLQQEAARRKDMDNANLGIAQAEFQESENARVERQQKGIVGVAPVDADVVRRKLENERLKAEVEIEVGPVPQLNRDNLRTRTQNTINEALADNRVSVLPVSDTLAETRKRSARDAQELKAYRDQYAGSSRADLEREASTMGAWRGQSGWQQRASALISAMESNGMEAKIYDTLRSNDISGEATIMSTLANSQNKVLKAYGKKGENRSYDDFMNGTGGGASMQDYINSKGRDFLNGIDDNALAEIAKYNSGSAMSTQLLAQAAAQANDQKSLDQINRMLARRNDVTVSGDQLANYGVQTINAIVAGGTDNMDALVAASNDIGGNAKLIGKLNPDSRESINSLRSVYRLTRI